MNYQEKEEEIDVRIRAELHRLREAGKVPLESSPAPDQLLSLFKRSPVRKVVRKLPVSSYIRRVRNSAEASVENFAAALGLSPDVIRQFETNELEPWALPAAAIAQVAYVLRLHLRALELLAGTSLSVARLSKTLTDPQASAQSMAVWLEKVRRELQRRGAVDLVD